jgi:hypothetical protein
MRCVAIGILTGLAFAGAAAAAEPSAETAQPKCVKAEINPVTGHVFCFEPLGAPVEQPPPEAALPCKEDDARGQWSYGPSCAPEPDGM